ncbi:Enterobactin exporter EntS [Austwickia sp. TVS 96-490-7B]|uniref:MFS transporter n=1 Tax=Austwickia sp. TVS 96-490-7B TaxID=2830843 RepID=UPI001C595DB9|nr:MFS transporter [Austwickia sp. TVS 96-490-7B]MBW3086098.1 Enterobactin exporter EntS [Austwickia sp. TVS 96-490-7B]
MSVASPLKPSRWGPLRHQEFAWFFLASSVNRLGSMMTSVAYAFAVLHVEGTATALSQVLVAQVTVNVVFLLFGGIISDRWSRRTVLMSTYLSSAVVLGTTASLLASGKATVGALTVLAAVSGAVGAFSMPAVQGLIPQLVPRHDLQQATAMVAFVRHGAQVIGPVLGAMLVAVGGATETLYIDAGSFLVAVLFLLPMRIPGRASVKQGIWQELRVGWHEFSTRTWLWTIVVAFCGLNVISSGALMVLGPLVAKNTASLGVTGWGLTMGAQAAIR